MPLTKQPISVNFSQGLDTKTDPFQVPTGKFLALTNSIFTKAGMLQKRNGFGLLQNLPDDTSTFLTTFNTNLTAIGTQLQAYIEGSKSWVNTGNIQPLELNTLPLIRSNTNQSQADSALSSNGFLCTVFTDNVPTSTGIVQEIKYVVSDSTTGQNIVPPGIIPTATGTPTGSARVFVLGNYFIIVFTNLIGSTSHLQFIALNTSNGQIAKTNTDIAASYAPSPGLSYDAVIANSNLYVAYNTTSGGQAIKVTYINQALTVVTANTFSGQTATLMGLSADLFDPSNPRIYVSWFNHADTTSHTLIVDKNLNTILAPISYFASEEVLNITGNASNGVLTQISELYGTYSYDNQIETHHIIKRTITQTGTVSAESVIIRSVGLASKSFIYNGDTYFLTAYQSPYQPSYFLVDIYGKIIAKLAYSNGGGYLTTGLPSVSLNANIAYIDYLYKDSIQAVNKNTNIPSGSQTAGIYAQTGVNLATFEIGTSRLTTSEIGNNLHISGGFITAYDGNKPVEQEFFLYPDSVEVGEQTTSLTPTANTVTGSPILTGVSSLTGIELGMTVSGTGIQANSLVIAIGGNSITLDQNATAISPPGAPITLTITGNVSHQKYFYQVTYEWSDNQGNLFRSSPSIPVSITTSTGNSVVVSVPTLRLTAKTANPVKIVIYRWSTAQQNYYQVTSIFMPMLNDTTIDSIDFVDALSDAQILGNNLIYTTGGVLENISPPASDLLTLFNNRLWLVDSEDRNLLWFSKQVIESVPVEMSDLLTIYVAPSTASQGSTGPITAIAPMDDKLIVFKKNALGYISGVGPDNTGANNQYSDFTLINSVVGSTNQQSIVFMPQGLMFQSNKGIWLLDRNLGTTYIGAPVEQYNSASVLSAINVPETNQVRFTLDNGVTLMYDYYFGQWGTFSNIPAVSSCVYNGLHTYINNLGQAFQETPGLYLDNSNPVLLSFTTNWMNLAGVQGYERFYQAFLLGKYITPFKLNVQFAYDYNASIQQSVIVTPDNFSPVYGGDQVWGSGSVWGGPSQVFESRIFPSTQKVESFQVTINEIFDASYGIVAGAGLTLSGMNLVVGLKKGYRVSSASRSFG